MSNTDSLSEDEPEATTELSELVSCEHLAKQKEGKAYDFRAKGKRSPWNQGISL